MALIAVLTGDLVDSTRVADPSGFVQRLQALLTQAEQRYGGKAVTFRGDGFQLALPEPRHAAECALFLRAGLIGASPSRTQRWDARIAVAVAADEAEPGSYGAAYVQSGRDLDELSRERLSFYADAPLFRLAAGLATALVDDLVGRWSASEAETYWVHLHYPDTHKDVAQQLGKSRATVTKTLLRGRYNLLDRYIADINELMEQTLAL